VVQRALWAADALRGIGPHLGVNERHLLALAAEVERLRSVLVAAHSTERLLTLRPTRDLRDAVAGIAWFNSLPHAERLHWLDVAGSAVPADAWEAFKRAADGAASGDR
jgi:hypothetical protein